MKIHALLVLSVGLLIAADAKDDDAAKKELKKLSGTYVLVSGESKGEKLPEKQIKGISLVIEGDKYTLRIGDKTLSGTQKIDPTKRPKEIEAMDTEGPNKGKTILGIYKLEKDEFTVCFAATGKDRPKEFRTKSGTGEFIHVWKKKAKE